MAAFSAHFRKSSRIILAAVPIALGSGLTVIHAPQASALSNVQRVSTLDTPYTDTGGNVWAARTGFEGGWMWGGPSADQDIAGTEDDALYRPEMVRPSAWRSAPLNAGTYQVTLKLREAWFDAPGRRVFEVKAEGTTQASDVDIFANVGKFKAYDKTLTVKVTDGRLDLDFVNAVDHVIVSAIEVKPYVDQSTSAESGDIKRMTVGSTALTDSTGRAWSPREGFSGGSHHEPAFLNDVKGTTDDDLYRPEYWGMSGWRFKVADGTYKVTLKLREAHWNGAGKRVFSVTSEGSNALTNVDIYKEAGFTTALDKSFTTTVTDGELTLAFKATADQPIVSAIRVTPMTASTPTPTPTSTQAPTPTPTQATTAEPALNPNVTLRPVDGGGPSYYGKFTNSLPTGDDFFPIAVWLESVSNTQDLALDKQAGLNTYAAITGGSNLALLSGSGMNVMAQHDLTGKGADALAGGWFLSDETDMWAGPGAAEWTGNWPGNGPICMPEGAECGYTVQQRISAATPADGKARWANYGKGILFWQNDKDAARFVNEFQDIVSADAYWFTDNNICSTWEGGRFLNPTSPRPLTEAECRQPSNYGATVKKVRSLVSPAGSKPVWAFVELGHPSGDNSWPTATPNQVKAGVWSSVIAGARGIVYFNHSFAGKCVSYHILRDSCYSATRAAVTAVNAQITQLAPVLNSPDAVGFVTSAAELDTLVKSTKGDVYLFTQSTSTNTKTLSIATACSADATVEVVGENRMVKMTAGKITDSFTTDNPTHVYKITGGAKLCGIPTS